MINLGMPRVEELVKRQPKDKLDFQRTKDHREVEMLLVTKSLTI